jgi:hypothetical protein
MALLSSACSSFIRVVYHSENVMYTTAVRPTTIIDHIDLYIALNGGLTITSKRK